MPLFEVETDSHIIITWAENACIFNDLAFAFRVTFLNKCDEMERPVVAEYYQRCFGTDPISVAAERQLLRIEPIDFGQAGLKLVNARPGPLQVDVGHENEVQTIWLLA